MTDLAESTYQSSPSRAGRKTDAEREERKLRAAAEARKLEQELTRAQPLRPDTRIALWFAVGLVMLLMAASFSVSFAGIYSVAAYTGLPHFLHWVPPLFIDLAILAYTLSLIIFKSRGMSTWRTLAGLAGFAALSVAANVAHTLSFWSGDLSDWRAWVGVVITASAPIAVLLASEEIGRLAFESEVK